MNDAPFTVLEARAVCCVREGGAALHKVSLEIPAGSFTAIVGEPRSGRNLLLRVLGLLEAPDAGELLVEGVPASELTAEARAEIRSARLGYVFAAPFLLPSFSVVENVAMPLFRIARASAERARQRSGELLEFVGMTPVVQTPAGNLPLIDQHRVSLARALVNEPRAVFIEELSELAAEELAQLGELWRQACARFDTAIIIAAPRSFALRHDDRVIELAAGVVLRHPRIEKELPA